MLDRIPCGSEQNRDLIVSVLGETCCPKATRKLAELYKQFLDLQPEIAQWIAKHLVCYLRNRERRDGVEKVVELAWEVIWDFMRHQSSSGKRNVLQELRKIGEDIVQPLAEKIEEVNEETQCMIVRTLANIGGERVLDVLAGISASEKFSPAVRAEAVAGLGKCVQEMVNREGA